MLKLGWTAKDKITGFQGVITGRVEYLTGRNQILLAPPVDEKGSPRDARWFDEQRCERVGADEVTLDNGSNPGCDAAAPVR